MSKSEALPNQGIIKLVLLNNDTWTAKNYVPPYDILVY